MKILKQKDMEMDTNTFKSNESFNEISIMNYFKSEKTTIMGLAVQLTLLLLTLPVITAILFFLLRIN